MWEVIGALYALREESPSLTDIDLLGALAAVTGLNAEQVSAALP